MAANFSADEKNAELKFQFMLHADKKSSGKWKDLPIPFPVRESKETEEVKDGISELPQHLQKFVIRED